MNAQWDAEPVVEYGIRVEWAKRWCTGLSKVHKVSKGEVQNETPIQGVPSGSTAQGRFLITRV
jgi:hypothetical protein